MTTWNCNCADWEKEIKTITDLIVFASIHGIYHTGKHFKFCPWCGRPLLNEKELALQARIAELEQAIDKLADQTNYNNADGMEEAIEWFGPESDKHPWEFAANFKKDKPDGSSKKT